MIHRMLITVGILSLVPATATAEDTPQPASRPAEAVVPFEADGLLCQLSGFFAVEPPSVQTVPTPAPPLTDLILVTADGVYALLEHPANEAALKDLKAGDAVRVKGRHYVGGSLLLLASAAKLDEAPEIDVEKFQKASGERLTLEGRNACQCALKLAGLPNSCRLGHLHHVQTAGGAIYHYIPWGRGVTLVRGRGAHNRPVKLTVLLLPGNHLIVDRPPEPKPK